MTKNEKTIGYSPAKIATIVTGLTSKDLIAMRAEHAKKHYAHLSSAQRNELLGYDAYHHVVQSLRPDYFDMPLTEARVDGITRICKKLMELNAENEDLKKRLAKVKNAIA